MRYISLTTALLPALSFAVPTRLDNHALNPRTGGNAQAIYYLSVNPAGSSVIAIEVGSNGMLTNSTSTTSTGGVGLQAINATSPMSDAPVAADPLQSQDSVVVRDNFLFTVNSGSDTVVMFRIDPANPLKLEMIGAPAPTLGQFPLSVAYSCMHQTPLAIGAEQSGASVCVLNGGAVNGVTCYNVDPKNGLIPDGVGLREFGFGSTTPSELFGKKGSGSDVQFAADSSKLIATFKGDAEPPTTGHIVVFDVGMDGSVSDKWTDNQIKPFAAVFGFASDPNNMDHIYITDASFGGGGLVKLDYDTNMVSVVNIVNSTKLAASCWVEYSFETGTFYQIDTGSPNFAVVNPMNGDLDGIINYDKKLGGGFDAAISGNLAYFLTATNIVGVFDLMSNKLVQEYTTGKPSQRPFWTGMATWPANPTTS